MSTQTYEAVVGLVFLGFIVFILGGYLGETYARSEYKEEVCVEENVLYLTDWGTIRVFERERCYSTLKN